MTSIEAYSCANKSEAEKLFFESKSVKITTFSRFMHNFSFYAQNLPAQKKIGLESLVLQQVLDKNMAGQWSVLKYRETNKSSYKIPLNVLQCLQPF